MKRFLRCAASLAGMWLMEGGTVGAMESVPNTYQGAGGTTSARQAVGDYLYEKPKIYTFLKRAPGDLKDYWVQTFRRENTLPIVLMVAGTGILIAADQWILDRAQDLGEFFHIPPTNNQRTFVSFKTPLTDLKFQGPYDSGSALYFLGDGWVDLWIAGGFLGYGSLRTDYRALQTSSQIFESVLTSGFVVQVLKHVTGRESPYVSTRSGGRWVFFPNQIEYHRHVPHYDAFPSGHLAAAMATVTVISENYPAHRYVRPVGYTLMGLLGFQMLNNGVHWVSDYPLAIALGHSFGQIAVRKGRTRREREGLGKIQWGPAAIGDVLGLRVAYRFN